MSNEATRKKYEANVLPQWGSLSTIKKLVGENKTILDVGCASGYLGELLMKKGNVLYGIDGNKEAIAVAEKKYQKAVWFDLNNSEPDRLRTLFSDTTFDVIIFADVLEHLLDPETTLRGFSKLLKPNGRIVVSLPNVALWRVRLNLLLGHFDYMDYGVLDRTHLHLYTFKTGKELIRNSGFSVVTEQGALNFWFFGILVRFFPFLRNILSIHIIIEGRRSVQ